MGCTLVTAVKPIGGAQPWTQALSNERPTSEKSSGSLSNSTSVSFIEWKQIPSQEEAKEKFRKDGTVIEDNDEHIDLRSMLEDPIAQNALGKFANSIGVLDSFMCWVDIQEYKSIPTEGYRSSKAIHIYHKYIKQGAVLFVNVLSDNELRYYNDFFGNKMGVVEHPNELRPDYFNMLQLKCFSKMYDNIYLPFKETPEFTKLNERLRKRYNLVRMNHFEYFEKLGEGSFGFVVHCKKKSTGKHYAMKIQTKIGMLKFYKSDMTRANLEKMACASCQHPFIVNLDYAFQTESLAIMVLGLATAGDLNTSMMCAPNMRLSEDRVRFYAAEIILALSYLHQMGLIYRDLKPQNVLLCDDGHIQLVDLGGVMDAYGDRFVVNNDDNRAANPLVVHSNNLHAPEISTYSVTGYAHNRADSDNSRSRSAGVGGGGPHSPDHEVLQGLATLTEYGAKHQAENKESTKAVAAALMAGGKSQNITVYEEERKRVAALNAAVGGGKISNSFSSNGAYSGGDVLLPIDENSTGMPQELKNVGTHDSSRRSSDSRQSPTGKNAEQQLHQLIQSESTVSIIEGESIYDAANRLAIHPEMLRNAYVSAVDPAAVSKVTAQRSNNSELNPACLYVAEAGKDPAEKEVDGEGNASTKDGVMNPAPKPKLMTAMGTLG
jgi:serine/threonine protein kinase